MGGGTQDVPGKGRVATTPPPPQLRHRSGLPGGFRSPPDAPVAETSTSSPGPSPSGPSAGGSGERVVEAGVGPVPPELRAGRDEEGAAAAAAAEDVRGALARDVAGDLPRAVGSRLQEVVARPPLPEEDLQARGRQGLLQRAPCSTLGFEARWTLRDLGDPLRERRRRLQGPRVAPLRTSDEMATTTFYSKIQTTNPAPVPPPPPLSSWERFTLRR